MKWIFLTIALLITTIIIIGYAIGGLVLAAILGALFGLLWTIATFALGSWWSKQLMESGAQIALTAQVSDDRWDERQASMLSKLFHDGIRAGQNYAKIEQPRYPALPFNIESESFRIDGFENE